MFTVSDLTTPVLYDFYRGSGAPIFRTYTPNSLRTSAPLYRIRSSRIKYKFVITRFIDCASFTWKNDTGIVEGSQEIIINLDFVNNNLDVNYSTETVRDVIVDGVTVSTNLVRSANTWIDSCTDSKRIDNYSIVNKVIIGGIVYDRFIGESSPVTLEQRFFEYQKNNNLIRIQTPDDTFYIGNQPMKVYGSAALGSDLSVLSEALEEYDTFTTNSGIQQGIYDF